MKILISLILPEKQAKKKESPEWNPLTKYELLINEEVEGLLAVADWLELASPELPAKEYCSW
jgi:hypothetical protein